MAGASGENAESPTISPRQQANRKPARNRLSCQVTLLDGTVLTTDHLQVSISFFNGLLDSLKLLYLISLKILELVTYIFKPLWWEFKLKIFHNKSLSRRAALSK